jgi:hypothetical protein
MSIFRDHAFGYNTTEKQERERELRRRINDNLKNIYSGKYRREADARRKDRRTELEKATANEIAMGNMVLERRELSKRLNRLLLKQDLEGAELEYAEDLQDRVDQLDEELSGYTQDELRRFVRLWNKSRKAKYKL